jgi:hypothetical protein
VKKRYLHEADRVDRVAVEGAANAFLEDNLLELR